ncbi:MAG: aryl-sulfate sulfotransferase [Chitinophagaceae bacterium]|nr:aryl-sulfate sulfotransferase [Chitinophagaceae bacterium]
MTRFLLLCLCAFSIAGNAQTVGWFYSNPGTADGYVLFAPGSSNNTYLLDKCGKKIHQWQSFYDPGLAVYLLEDGTLLRCGNTNNSQFMGGGQGGIVEKFDWNSNLLWYYKISDSEQCQHHDAIQLPNGNVLAIAWEYHTKADAQANGRVSLGTKMWSDKIVEIQPVGADSGIIVWQWRAWDHLVQDVDNAKANYGVVTEHPELLDINLGTLNTQQADWLHLNGLSYNETLDQLMVSCHNLNEIFIIDHSTTLEESASHAGGNSGHGGDLMYRWGNPENYDRGTTDDRKLYQQHHAHWTSDDDNEILYFNNGVGRPGTDYSTVETFKLPAMVNNNYPLGADSAYLPLAQNWIYAANPVSSLFSMVMGSAQRLPNGNTLICNATAGTFLEIDSQGNNLWKYVNPIDQNGNTAQGDQPFMNSCFRVTNYAADYPGLAGQVLTPGEPLELNPDNYICSSIPTLIADVDVDDQNPSVYPNPFRNNFNLHIPAELKQASLQIHDVTGRLLYEENNIALAAHTDHQVSLLLPPGVVIISVKDALQLYSWNTRAVVQ